MSFLSRVLKFFTILCLTGICTVFIINTTLHLFEESVLKKRSEMPIFCKIPQIEPYDKSISRFVKHNGPIKCQGKSSVTYVDGNTLRINWTSVTVYEKKFHHCSYRPIFRGRKKSDEHFEYGNISLPFTNDTTITDEFIKIECFAENDSVFYTNFHAFILPKKEVAKTCDNNLARHREENRPREIMNVLMIGLDSVSRLNSVRQMPKLRKYLLEEMNAFEMFGYTKVADNTFVNVVPILTGKFVEELPWNETMKKMPLDKYDYIWKNFTQNGYRTLYVEDAPEIATFTYLKRGFKEAPAHHYNRPFSVAMETEDNIWNSKHKCVNDKLETDICLEYVRDFARLYHDKPHFGYSFITRLTHDHTDSAGAADEPHYKFVKSLHEEGLLNNTVLIYFSDHGMRFGSIRNTYVGKVEERMPMLMLVFPKWFREKYPRITENMEINTRRLTTHFDLHETLKDLVNFQGNHESPTEVRRGISLFTEVPPNRTCEDAAILSHWCVCLEKEDVSKESEDVQKAAQTVLDYINNKLSKVNTSCAVLRVEEIQTVQALVANNDILKFKKSVNDVINRTVHFGAKTNARVTYQLTLILAPGGGIFEATVNMEESSHKFTPAGDISRINAYGDQSSCVNDHELKKYCFCKSSD